MLSLYAECSVFSFTELILIENVLCSNKYEFFMKKLLLLCISLFLGLSVIQLDAAVVSNTNDSGAGSLRDAVANTSAGGEITFSTTGTITLSSQIIIDKALTITGPGVGSLTISGGTSTRIFVLNSGADLTINGVTLANGRATGSNGDTGEKYPTGCATAGGGGGGGGALGAAMFVNNGAVLFAEDLVFNNNTVIGGDGGNAGTSGSGRGGTGNTVVGGNGGDGSRAGVGANSPGGAGGFACGGGGTGSTGSCNPSGKDGGAGGYMAGDGGDGGYDCCGSDDGGGGGGGAGLGGALFAYNGAQITLVKCTFSNNTATGGAGGISNGSHTTPGIAGQGKGAAIFAMEEVIIEAYSLSFSGNSSSSNSNTNALAAVCTLNDNDDVYGKVSNGPYATKIQASSPNGIYEEGEVVTIDVTFTQNIDVSGTPQLTLETGATDGVASYTSGSGSKTLSFSYTIGASQAAVNLDAKTLATNGGSMRHTLSGVPYDSPYDAELCLPTGSMSGSLQQSSSVAIVLSKTIVTNSNASGAGSLKDAVDNATDNTGIVFDPSLAGSTITPSTSLSTNKKLVIDASDVNGITVSGGNSRNIFIQTGGELKIIGLTLTNGKASGDPDWGGGAVIVCPAAPLKVTVLEPVVLPWLNVPLFVQSPFNEKLILSPIAKVPPGSTVKFPSIAIV
jgi:hypothetical protein